jgi:hypothetical protein
MRVTIVLVTGVLSCLASCNDGGGSGSCPTLAAGQLADQIPDQHVMLEVQFALVDQDSFDDLGLSFPLTAPVETDNGGSFGGVSRHGRDIAVDGNTVGGVDGIPYLVLNGVANLYPEIHPNFAPTVGSYDVYVGGPIECFKVDPAAAVDVQNLVDGAELADLTPTDPALAGVVVFDVIGRPDAAVLLGQIAPDARNIVIETKLVEVYDLQRTVLGLRDVLDATLDDVRADVKTPVESVVPNPVFLSTGATVDVRSTISGTSIEFLIRLGSEVIGVPLSVPFLMGTTPSDAVVPFIRPSTNHVTITVPDGQVLVLGGLLRQGQTEAEKGLPLLNNIPLVGTLFTRRSAPERQNLVVFITPTIVDD